MGQAVFIFTMFGVRKSIPQSAIRSNLSYPYRKWLEDVRGIASHHVGAWLRTEYDTVVIRAHNAADRRVFERDKDIMPNLRWMPTTSPTPEGSHRAFWERRVTLPVGHPFWDRHHPGDRWNCKCSLEQTDDPETPVPADGEKADRPQRGLENNPGRDGHIYNDTHPYFPKSCSECDFYRKANLKNRLLGGFTNRKKDCYNCPYIDGCLDRMKGKEMARQELQDERKSLLASGSMGTNTELATYKNLKTKELLPSHKSLKRLVNHCLSLDELDAAKYLWLNPGKLRFVRESPMGEGKDMEDPKAQKNIAKKQERGIVGYNQYSLKYDGRKWDVKLEEHEKGFEQMYFIRQSRKQ